MTANSDDHVPIEERGESALSASRVSLRARDYG